MFGLGRIVWFGLVAAGAPAEAVLVVGGVTVGAIAYGAYRLGKKRRR